MGVRIIKLSDHVPTCPHCGKVVQPNDYYCVACQEKYATDWATPEGADE